MNKLMYSAFLIYIFLTLITAAVHHSHPNTVVGSGHIDKRNQKCSCAVAISDFDGSYGIVKGLVTYAQDETGCTIVTGIFSEGFENKNATYKVKIVDPRDILLHDLTAEG